MKRTIAAFGILALCLVIAVWSCLSLLHTLDRMEDALQRAAGKASEGMYGEAMEAVLVFDDLFREHERLFETFIKRELLYNLQSDSGTLKAYANEDNRNDFLAEAFKARRHLNIIRDSLLGPY